MNTCIRLREALAVEAGESKHQLLIDQSVAKDARSRSTNLAISWIDYKKAYASVPHACILECLRLHKINSRLVTFIRQSMSHWRNLIRKLKEYRRCHHQMRYISRGCSVTLAVLYGAQPIECLAGQEYLWIQVQKWYHYQPPPLHGRHKAIRQE